MAYVGMALSDASTPYCECSFVGPDRQMPASHERHSRLNVLGRYGAARSLTSASDDLTARTVSPAAKTSMGGTMGSSVMVAVPPDNKGNYSYHGG